jgi:hypothetical protein
MSTGKCVNCKERPATLDWVGDGGVLAYTHGMSVRWCEVCATRAQLEHAQAAAQRIPELETKLRTLLGAGTEPPT